MVAVLALDVLAGYRVPMAKERVAIFKLTAEEARRELRAATAGLQREGRSEGDRVLRLPEVLKLTGLSRATVYRLERAGTFPKRKKISANAAGWSERAVRDWIAAKLRG